MIIFLILTTMLLSVITASIEITDTVTVSDIDVQDSLAAACKAAAGQICDTAQANGYPGSIAPTHWTVLKARWNTIYA